MDSSVPPPPRTSLRPSYLIAAMVLTWFAGVYGFTTGCSDAAFLHDGPLPDVASLAQNAHGSWDLVDLDKLLAAVRHEAMHLHVRVAYPLAVFDALLAGLLMVASGLAMTGRRGARTLALQALLASAVFAVVAYAVTRDVRAASIHALMRVAAALPSGAPEREAISNNEHVFWWLARFKLVVIDLGPLALGALALTRARTKTYFDAMARAIESSGEP